MKKKMVALCASALTFCSSMTVLTPAIANAEECKGVTERKEVAKDFDNTMRSVSYTHLTLPTSDLV